jgi:hypothetical protein
LRNKLLVPFLLLILAGCEQLGIEDPTKIAAAKEAEGRAVGSACRHSGRALEDCYTMNSKAPKAAVFTGWRDMDAYMRENNIEVVTPQFQKTDKYRPTSPATSEDPSHKAEDAVPAKKDGTAQPGEGKPAPATKAGGKVV